MNKKGIVYALINPAMPGYIKIGKTTRDIETRINELSASSGVPHKYVCAYSIEVNDCHTVEKKLHEDFSKYRISNNREFFNIDLQRVVEKMFQIKQNDILKEKIISKEKESILDFTQNIKSDCLKETLIEKSKVDEITTKHKFDKYGYNKEGFHKDGFHKDTKNKYNRFGYDIDGYNRNGFNKKGYHKETGTFYNLKGYDMNGHQKEGIQKKSNKLKQNNKSVRLYNEKANEHFKKYF